MKKIFFQIPYLFLVALFISCGNSDIDIEDLASSADYEDATDYVWNSSNIVYITLNQSNIECSSSNVTVNGSNAIISAGGTYEISGTLTDGQIIINSTDDKAVQLILNGVVMANSTTSPLYIKKSEKTILILAEGSTNTISDAKTYQYAANEDEPSAAIFSNSNLTLYGTGTLNVRGYFADGISSDDGIIIKSGTINVTAVDDAIRGKDFLIVDNGQITAVASSGHALKSDNEKDDACGYITIENGILNLTSTNKDGMHASRYITVNDGTLTVSAVSSQGLKAEKTVAINGGILNIIKSHEGIESNYIKVNGGTLSVISSDDSFNSTIGNGGEQNDGSCIYITGGNITLNTSSGDGLDSNGSIEMTAGTVIIHGPQSNPEVAIDYNGSFNISGGVLVASGTNSNMTQAPGTSSSQYSLKVMFRSSLSSSTLFHIEDSYGSTVLTYQPVRTYYSVIFSSPALKNGYSYSIYTGGSSTGSASNGLYSGGTYSGGTKKTTFTIGSKVTSVSVN